MKDKFLCVMAEYDKETELRLKELQQILRNKGFVGKQTPDLLNHVTLGTFDTNEEDRLKSLLKTVSLKIDKFDIRLNNIGLFGLNVLFIAPNVNKELLELQQYFQENFADGHKWAAHTTMLIDEPEIIREAIPIVAENFIGFDGKIEKISLYEFWPTRFILRESLL